MFNVLIEIYKKVPVKHCSDERQYGFKMFKTKTR